jgi:multidrug transporter EmrE-like cation transporter
MTKVSPAGWLFIMLTVALTVVGQLLVKQGMLHVGSSPTRVSLLPRFFWRTFTNTYVIMGLLAAVFAAVSWTLAVSRENLSVAYPFMGLAIVLVLTLSGAFFGESVPMHRWIGVAIVCLGLFVAARA